MDRILRRRLPLLLTVTLCFALLIGSMAPTTPAARVAAESKVLPQFSAPPDDAPRPTITTTGPAGTPAVMRRSDSDGQTLQKVQFPSPAFYDGFEAGLGDDWAIYDASQDGYERSWGLDDWNMHDGIYSLWVASGGVDGVDPASYYYPHNLDAWLITNGYVNLSQTQWAYVDFYMDVDTEPDYDYVFVGASLDGENFYGEYWTGYSGGWQQFGLDLSAFVGYPQVYLGWYFHSDEDNAGENYEGVWLDDISLWTFGEEVPVEGQELLQNGGFETGDTSGWQIDPGSDATVVPIANPVRGNYAAQLGARNNANDSLYQNVSVPGSGASGATLGFWLNGYGQEMSYEADVLCAGVYSQDGSELLIDLGCLDAFVLTSATFDPMGWWYVEYPLFGQDWEAVRGRTVRIAFQAQTNGSAPSTFLLDDVSLELTPGETVGDGYEPNNSMATATAITPGSPLGNATINPGEDWDYYRFSATAGDTVVVDIDAAANGSPLDSYVELYDATGNLICENDDDGQTVDSYVSCIVPSTGTYYAVVSSYDGTGHPGYSYSILVTKSGSGQPTPTLEPTAQPTPTPPSSDNQRSWTVMLYLAGDNNLCRFVEQLIPRLEREINDKIGPTGFVNVAVLFDRDPGYCTGGGTTRYLIQPNGNYGENVNRWDMGELNMGNPQTLINFASWAMRNYPADRYFLAIDDHGDGTQGIAWDDSNNHDHLSNDELYSALKQITGNGSTKIDLMAYEACLMGLYEVAYDVREFVDHVLFFQTISWANNASYPSYMADPRFTKDTTGRQFGDVLFDVYYDAVRNPYAISLIDTAHMADVRTAVDNWADALSGQLGTSKSDVTAARSAAQKMEVDLDWQITNRDWYVDLWHLADQTAARGLAVSQSAAVKAAVEAAVLRTAYRPATSQYQGLTYGNTHGLSIFWPEMPAGDYGRYVDDRIFSATRDGTWDEFLQAYFGPRPRMGMPVNRGPVPRLPATTLVYEVALPIIQR